MVRTMWAGTDLYKHACTCKHKFVIIIITIECTMMQFIKLYYTFILGFRNGHLPLAKYLIEDLKCSPTCTSTRGHTPLHEACR